MQVLFLNGIVRSLQIFPLGQLNEIQCCWCIFGDLAYHLLFLFLKIPPNSLLPLVLAVSTGKGEETLVLSTNDLCWTCKNDGCTKMSLERRLV